MEKQFEATVVTGSLVGAILLVLIALFGPAVLAWIFASICALGDIYKIL